MLKVVKIIDFRITNIQNTSVLIPHKKELIQRNSPYFVAFLFGKIKVQLLLFSKKLIYCTPIYRFKFYIFIGFQWPETKSNRRSIFNCLRKRVFNAIHKKTTTCFICKIFLLYLNLSSDRLPHLYTPQSKCKLMAFLLLVFSVKR